ncbi:ribokinase [Aureimonas endophytica]|uniref:Ribokinase n=1 Tax=Aureimonas endophytica TaxID=2027858 RepID=A0A916ZUF7_9HYPH|nr:ribokinase [Aureimonas endophytica]GGE12065.1 ribokinase [Aureimonas endophytica]
MPGQGVAILGIFVADLAFRSGRMPAVGETIAGSGFAMGPGGKGSNQAVAAARAGASVRFVSKLGRDAFGDIAVATWEREGIAPHVARVETATGAAFIYVNEVNGENAIIVVPGAAGSLSPGDVEAARDAIASAAVFVTQLEQPQDAALRGLEIAREAGVATIFNPAPAAPVDDVFYGLSSFVVPNETEAAALTGLPLRSLDDARRAGDWFLAKGAGTALITLGERGVLLHGRGASDHVPAVAAGPVVETAGAGDAFVGAFAAALAKGLDPLAAARFGAAAAGISVTRPGTAPSMPHLDEVQALLARA